MTTDYFFKEIFRFSKQKLLEKTENARIGLTIEKIISFFISLE